MSVHKRTYSTIYASSPQNCSMNMKVKDRMNQESEKTLETRLRKEIEKRGGMALKLSSQLHRGLPDRMVLLPNGVLYFVEMKTTGKRPTHLQTHCHEQLRALHFSVLVIDSTEKLQDFLTIVDHEQLEIKSRNGLR